MDNHNLVTSQWTTGIAQLYIDLVKPRWNNIHIDSISILKNKDQSFVCWHCKVQTNPEPKKPDSFGHFTEDSEAAHVRYTQTAGTLLWNTMPLKICPAFDTIHLPIRTFIDRGSLKLVKVLGVGGCGIIYHVIDTCHYAVKYLVTPGHCTACHWQIYIHKIALHQVAMW